MFVHAYQSYIFNVLLSERIKDFESLKLVEEGDFAAFVSFKANGKRYYVFKEDFSVVSNSNKKRVEFLIDKRYATLALPLVGYETEIEDGWVAEKLKRELEKDEINLNDFKHEYREFSSKGSFRSADMLIEWTNLAYYTNNNMTFEFYLPKGCYATIFLREFMKPDV